MNSDIFQELVSQLAQQSGLEYLAVILALGYVWLAAKQSIWCWPCALLSTAIYTYLFWEVSLPFHTGLNAYYMAMAVYGWVQWNKPLNATLEVKVWPVSRHLLGISVLTLVSLGLAVLAEHVLNAEHVYLDAFITVFSIFTTVLVAHKVRENWLYWMVINSFAAYLYFVMGLYPTSLLFVLYLGFAIYGYISWGKPQRSLDS